MSKSKKNNGAPKQANSANKSTDALSKVVNNSVGDSVANAADPANSNVVPDIASSESKKTTPAAEADKKETKHSKETHAAMEPYVKAYPDAKHFLIASDGQVFLPANVQDAKVHQKHLDEKKSLVIYIP